jgi:hypothetical protein
MKNVSTKSIIFIAYFLFLTLLLVCFPVFVNPTLFQWIRSDLTSNDMPII